MTNYYIYYRVNAQQLQDLRTSVQRLFKIVESETGVRGRWMRRRDDAATYMEVYEGVNDGAALEALLEQHCKGFAVPRRQEVFRMANLTD